MYTSTENINKCVRTFKTKLHLNNLWQKDTSTLVHMEFKRKYQYQYMCICKHSPNIESTNLPVGTYSSSTGSTGTHNCMSYMNSLISQLAKAVVI